MTHPLRLLNTQLVSISSHKKRHNAAVSALTLAILLGLSGCIDKQTESESRTELATQANEAAEQQAALVQRVEAERQAKIQHENELSAKSQDMRAEHMPYIAQYAASSSVAAPGLNDDWQGAVLPERNQFEKQVQNGIMVAGEIPVSTFSIDVDTGSYTTLRRMLKEGRLPQKDTLRVEEMLNYFSYNYPQPNKNEAPFSVTTELAPSPYNDDMMLLRIGLKGYEQSKAELGASNLVFLLDVSGSMASDDKLPLLQTALKMLTQQLDEQDKVSIVVYAGAAGVVLDGAAGNDIKILTYALEQLTAGGSTNGAEGIQLAYQIGRAHV